MTLHFHSLNEPGSFFLQLFYFRLFFSGSVYGKKRSSSGRSARTIRVRRRPHETAPPDVVADKSRAIRDVAAAVVFRLVRAVASAHSSRASNQIL